MNRIRFVKDLVFIIFFTESKDLEIGDQKVPIKNRRFHESHSMCGITWEVSFTFKERLLLNG
jgi:hypothetical protein